MSADPSVTTLPAPVPAAPDVAKVRWPSWYTVVLLCCAAIFIAYLDRTNISVAAIPMKEQFGWSETTKGIVLSSFFVGYLVLQIASGTLANRYGGKVVLGVAVLWWSLFTMLTPPAAFLSLPALIAARVALGLGEAAVFPASINMIGRWVPASRRSRAVALSVSGLSLGTVISLPATGALVRAYGWPMPFYLFGILGFVWATAWYFGVGSGHGPDAERPVESPAGRAAIPWRRLLRTPAVWAIFVSHFSHNWMLYLLLAWLPSYFKSTFGVSLASAGLLSAAPWLVSFVVVNAAGTWADRMMERGRSATFVRKLLIGAGSLGASSFLLLLPQVGAVTAGVLLMCGVSGMLAVCQAGFAPNSFDVAPRYADVIWGISNTFATIPGIVGVAVTGWLVDQTGSYDAPFLLAAGLVLAAAAVYLALGSGRRLVD